MDDYAHEQGAQRPATRRRRIRALNVEAQHQVGDLLPLAACDCDNDTCQTDIDICVAADEVEVEVEIEACGIWG